MMSGRFSQVVNDQPERLFGYLPRYVGRFIYAELESPNYSYRPYLLDPFPEPNIFVIQP